MVAEQCDAINTASDERVVVDGEGTGGAAGPVGVDQHSTKDTDTQMGSIVKCSRFPSPKRINRAST